jgi:hypothetical protein
MAGGSDSRRFWSGGVPVNTCLQRQTRTRAAQIRTTWMRRARQRSAEQVRVHRQRRGKEQRRTVVKQRMHTPLLQRPHPQQILKCHLHLPSLSRDGEEPTGTLVTQESRVHGVPSTPTTPISRHGAHQRTKLMSGPLSGPSNLRRRSSLKGRPSLRVQAHPLHPPHL